MKSFGHSAEIVTAQPAVGDVVTVADADLLFHGHYKRAGSDLVISDDHGKRLVIEHYFSGDKHPALMSRSGAMLSADVVDALAGPVAPGQYAQAAPTPGPAAIGRVATVSGDAAAVRNGVVIALNAGDAILKGDVLQTGSSSALGVLFTDGTAFNLSSSARMVVNEFVYDPNGSANSAAISLVQGTISFLAGKVAKTGDMKVGTPVATMGIRGTAVNVTISADNGATTISVMAEQDNLTHTVVVTSLTGVPLGIVTSSNGVFTFSPSPAGVIAAETGKDLATVQKELAIVQQVFQTQAIGLQFLQAPDNLNTKTADAAHGTQFLVSDRLTTHDAGGNQTSGPTTVKVTIGDHDTTKAGTTDPNHVNSAPVANADSNDVVESGVKATNVAFAGTRIATGNVLANDTDPDKGFGDTKTVTDVSAVSEHLHGALTLGAHGAYTYTLDNQSPLTQALAAGEIAHDVFSYTISDLAGWTSTATLTITITGTDDAPVITALDRAQTAQITEQDLQTGLATPDVATGVIHFTDVDLSDRPTATISGQAISYLAADGHTVLTLTSAEMAELKAAFTIAPETINANDGTIDWTYSIADKELDFLAKGETVTLTSTVLVDDQHGGTDATTVTITITGTDDVPNVGVPIIAPDDKVETGTITERASTTGSSLIDQAVVGSGPGVVGTIHFTDIDSSDRPSATIQSQSATYLAANGTTALTLTGTQSAALLAAFTIVAEAGNTNNGAIDWTYKIADNAIDFLAVNETVFVTSIVKVNDHNGGIDTSTVTVTITGTNDAPVITSGTQTGAVTEDADNAVGENSETHHQFGTITFGDVDLSDVETSSITNTQVSANLAHGYALTTGQHDALVNAFSIAAATHSSATGAGTIGWNYDLADSALDFLGANDQVVLTYTVQTSDGNGGTAHQDVTITIKGTEDAPVITSGTQTGAVTEDADNAVGENSETHHQFGTITFGDVDLSDVETSSITNTQVSANLAHGYALTTGQHDALVNAFSIAAATHSSATGAGTIGWNYDLADSALDFLGANDQVVLTYTVQTSDGNGGTAHQDVTITIKGTEDAPVITSGTQTGAVTEDADNAVGENSETHHQFGTITFGDVDLSDVETSSITNTQVSANLAHGYALTTGQHDALVNAFSIAAATHSSATGAGTIGWNYDLADSALDFLGANDQVVLTYTVQTSDGNGGTAHQDVTITIKGTEDAPVIDHVTAVATGGATERADGAADENTATLSTSGTIAFADVDLTDAHTVTPHLDSAIDSATGLSTSERGTFTPTVTDASTGDGHGVVTWTYTVGDGALDDLAAGQTITQVYTVTVKDSANTTDTQTVTVTLTGANDDAVISVASGDHDGGAVTEDHQGTTETASGTLSFADVDLIDSHTVSGVTASDGALGTLTANVTQDATGAGTGGVIGWSYSVADSAIQYLADGEQKTETFTLHLSDGTSTVDKVVTVTLTGANDDAVISVASGDHDGGAVTEDHQGTTETASGTLSFADVDLIDSHTVSGVTASDGALGTLTANVTQDATGAGTGGVIGWSYSVADSAIQYLADGEQKTETFTLHLSDGTSTVDKVVTVTLTGANDDAVISVASGDHDGGAVTEDHQGTTETASGTLSFADVDLIDSHTVSGVTASDGALGTLTANVTQDATGAGTGGVIGWSYSVADSAIQYLADGEQKTETFTLHLSDGTSTVDKVVTVTLTGANDDAVISVASGDHDGGAVTEDHQGTTETASGTLSFADVDLIDSHTVSGVTASDGALGTLTANVTQDATGAGTGGVIGWSYSVADSAIQYLADGEQKTETFTLHLSDGTSTVDKVVTVTLTGTNDTPTIAAVDAGALIDTSASDSFAALGGTLQGSDADHGETATLTYAALDGDVAQTTAVQGTYGALTVDAEGTYSYLADPTKVNALSAGDYTDAFTVQTTDIHSTSGTATLTVHITGVNDAPTATPLMATVGEDDGSHVVNLSTTGTFDAEGNALTVVNLTASGSLNGGDPISGTPSLNGNVLTNDLSQYQYLHDGDTLVLTADYDLTDGHGGSVHNTATLTIHGANDAPVLTASAPTLSPINEDQQDNPGQSVASFAGSSIGDADRESVKGIAITGATHEHGVWQYSTDGGSSWSVFATYTAGSALLLAGSDLVRFHPDAINGDTDQLTYVAWDQTTGTHGQTGNSSVAGGTTAFSTSSDTATITVASIDDAPVVTAGTTASYTENGQPILISPLATVTDVDNGDFGGGSLTVSLDTTGTSTDQLSVRNEGTGAGQVGVGDGHVTYEGTIIGGISGGADGSDLVVSFNGDATPAIVQAVLDNVGFSNSSDNPAGGSRSVTYTVDDGAGAQGTAHATVTVIPVNDAPTVTADGSGDSAGATVAEVDPTIHADGHLTVSDADGTDTATLAQYGVSLELNGNLTTADALGTTDNALLSYFTIPTGDALSSGSTSASFAWAFDAPGSAFDGLTSSDVLTLHYTIQPSDGHQQTNTGNGVVTITVDGTNDAPVAVDDTASITAGDAPATGNVLANDTDADTAHSALTVTALPNDALTEGDVVTYTADGTYGELTVTSNGAAAGHYTYTLGATTAQQAAVAALSAGEQQTDEFIYTVGDGQGGSTDGHLNVTVTGVNDAPTVDLDSSATGTGSSVNLISGVDAIPIAATSAIADIDHDATVHGAAVVLTDGQAGDYFYVPGETATNTGSIGGSGITWTITGTAGDVDHPLTVTFGGTFSASDYEEAIQQVSFGTAAGAGDRHIDVTVNDGTTDSPQATATVSVQEAPPTDNPPVTDDVNASGPIHGALIPVTFTGNDDGQINYFEIATLPDASDGILYSDTSLTPVQIATLVTANANQAVVYFAPGPNWDGAATFQYFSVGNAGQSDPHSATAIIHASPVAVNDNLIISADALTIAGSNDEFLGVTPGTPFFTWDDSPAASLFLMNDSGDSGLALDYNGFGGGTEGNAADVHSGTFVYSLNDANDLPSAPGASLTDSFTYTATDNSLTASATVTLSIVKYDAGAETGNTLAGTTADEIIIGATNVSDRIDGGAGNDILVGGHDDLSSPQTFDTFVFAPTSGHDIVRDFQPATDKIELNSFEHIPLDMYGEIDLAAWQSAGGIEELTNGSSTHDVLLHLDTQDVTDHDTILLKNVTISALQASDFVVHPLHYT